MIETLLPWSHAFFLYFFASSHGMLLCTIGAFLLFLIFSFQFFHGDYWSCCTQVFVKTIKLLARTRLSRGYISLISFIFAF